MAKSIKNIPLKTFRKFLESRGCHQIRKKGGHEIWCNKDTLRPVTIQSHIDPIPTFIVLNNLKTLGVTKKEFLEAIDKL